MKKIVFAIAVSILLASLPFTSLPHEIQESNVEIHFAWFHWGIVIMIFNGENASLHNVFIQSLDVAGLIFLGANWLDYLSEVGSYSVAYLIIPVCGLGHAVVTATISYEYEGETYEKTIHGFFLVLGATTILLEEW